jgi:hypothetical protein
MLRIFAMGFKCFCKCFRRIFQVFHLSSDDMLQVLHLDVSKVDQMFHMFQCDPPAAAAGGAREVEWGADATWGRVGRIHRVGSGGT